MSSVKPPAKPLGILQRLRTPAPKTEDRGFIGVWVFSLALALPFAGGILNSVAHGRLVPWTAVVGILTVAGACLIALALVRREPWAYWVLCPTLWCVWLLCVWIAASNPMWFASPNAVVSVWWGTFDVLVIAYLYRRRWWFGVDVPSSIPEETREGGRLALFFSALIGTYFIARTVHVIVASR